MVCYVFTVLGVLVRRAMFTILNVLSVSCCAMFTILGVLSESWGANSCSWRLISLGAVSLRRLHRMPLVVTIRCGQQ